MVMVGLPAAVRVRLTLLQAVHATLEPAVLFAERPVTNMVRMVMLYRMLVAMLLKMRLYRRLLMSGWLITQKSFATLNTGVDLTVFRQ